MAGHLRSAGQVIKNLSVPQSDQAGQNIQNVQKMSAGQDLQVRICRVFRVSQQVRTVKDSSEVASK